MATPGFTIETFTFNKPIVNLSDNTMLASHRMGINWPVVYILSGNNEVYVGETTSADHRMNNHLDPNGTKYSKRKKITNVNIVFDERFNKSAVLDIEQELIRLFDYEITHKKSDFFSVLQNDNKGQSKSHNYFNRAYYQQEVEEIWRELRARKLATCEYQDIVNDVLFKFSPYSNLNSEQRSVCFKILGEIMDALESGTKNVRVDYTAKIEGAAGTGKTIVLLYMLRCIMEAINSNQTNFEADDDDIEPEELGELQEYACLINRIKTYINRHGKLKIAYVAQMSSLRGTIATVLKEFKYNGKKIFNKKDAIGPCDVVTQSFSDGNSPVFEPFDILFIDEAHRLCQRKSISWMGSFDKASRKLYENVNPGAHTTLDWLIKCSKTRVLVYDELQTVKDSDITPTQFEEATKNHHLQSYCLRQQMRCRAGEKYIQYLNDIFDGKQDLESLVTSKKDSVFNDYKLRLYDNPNLLIDDICELDEEEGLSKVTAGYGWQWNTRKYEACKKYCNQHKIEERNKRVEYYLKQLDTEDDGLIIFDDRKYVRNIDFDWILKGDPREIGCIHTSQGYDLNYVGVLFGPEIDYVDGQIKVDISLIKDVGVSTSLRNMTNDEKLEKINRISRYVINAYKVMMERGIKGCFVYAHNKGLQEYLKKYIKQYDTND